VIERIVLQRFGKFRDVSFPLGEVTVFTGPNESGKTTIADALLQGLCQPPRNRKAGQELAARYGEDRVVSVVPEPDERIDVEEFQSLLAVASGNTHFDLPAGAPWLETLKAELFSGGIDPRYVARLLEREAGTARSTTWGKRLAEAKAGRDRTRETLAALGEARTQALGRERRLDEASARLGRVEAELESRRAEAETLGRTLRQQELIAQRRRCMDAVRVVDDLQAVENGLQRLARVSTDEAADLEQLERAAHGAEEDARRVVQDAEHHRRVLDDTAAATVSMRKATEALEARAILAARLLSRAVPDVQQHTDRRVRYRWPLVAISAVLVLGAAGVLALLSPPVSFLAGAALGALALAAFILSRRVEHVRDAESEGRAAAASRDEWRRATGEELGETAAARTETLLRAKVQWETAQAEVVAREPVLDRMRGADEARGAEANKARAASAHAAGALARFLEERGCRTTKEYAALRDRYGRGLEARKRLADRVQALQSEYGVSSRDELRRECQVRIGGLDHDITERELDEPARRRCEARARELDAEIKEKTRLWNVLNTQISEERGQIKGSLGDLPERIRLAEQEAEHRGAEAADIEMSIKAAGLAAGLMQSIAGDTDGRLEGLSEEIESLYAGIVGVNGQPSLIAMPQEPGVRLENLGLQGATVRDAGGRLLPFAGLSQGTRDAFALAARLALASKTGRSVGVLALDEPFLALDPQRMDRALRVLDRFREQQGWQIIILTKDPALVRGARATFGTRLVVHELGGG
jgi:energy-coupling factor transporter ATP-binding protein EcfA2